MHFLLGPFSSTPTEYKVHGDLSLSQGRSVLLTLSSLYEEQELTHGSHSVLTSQTINGNYLVPTLHIAVTGPFAHTHTGGHTL